MNRDFTFDADDAADLLALLANPNRLKVLGLIAKEEWSVSALATEIDLSQSALSQHLKKFRDANVVGVRAPQLTETLFPYARSAHLRVG